MTTNFYDAAQIGAELLAADAAAKAGGDVWIARATITFHVNASDSDSLAKLFADGYRAAGIRIIDDSDDKKKGKDSSESERKVAPDGAIFQSSVLSMARKAWGTAGIGSESNIRKVADTLRKMDGIRPDQGATILGNFARAHGFVPLNTDSLGVIFPAKAISAEEEMEKDLIAVAKHHKKMAKRLESYETDDPALQGALDAEIGEHKADAAKAEKKAALYKASALENKEARAKRQKQAVAALAAAGAKDGDIALSDKGKGKKKAAPAPVTITNLAAFTRKSA